MAGGKPLAVVTGAGSGIGAAVARRLSADGHPLLLLGRHAAPLAALDLPHALCVAADVRDRQAVGDAVRDAAQRYGDPDCLVNCAGLMRLGNAVRQPYDDFMEMLAVNLAGTFNAIQCVLPGMVRRRQGTIFNVSSIAGRMAFPVHAGYCASKFGVHGLSAALGMDLAAHRIRVVTVAPGVVDTELLEGTTDRDARVMFEDWLRTLESVLTPDDVARSIAFAYQQPQHVCLREIYLTSTAQTS